MLPHIEIREGVKLQEQISFFEILVLHTILLFEGMYFTIPFYIEYAHAKFPDDENSFL
jgi:hypothetical protein